MDDEKLISLVHRHEELFNVLHKKYSDNTQKDKTWRAIGEELHQSGNTCKTRWFNLRDQYRRAMKSKRTKGGHVVESKKKWKYEDEMSFLRPFLQERDAVPFMLQMDESNNYAEGDAGESQTTYEVDDQVENLREKDVQESTPKEQERERRKSGTYGRSKKRNLLPEESLPAVLMNYIIKKSKPACKPDQIDHFFLSVAATVKTLSPIRQNVVKAKIFSIVSEIELEQLNEVGSRKQPLKCAVPPRQQADDYEQESFRSQTQDLHY